MSTRHVLKASLVSLFLASAPATAAAAGWTTAGVEILTPAQQPFIIQSVNWYGAETRNFVPHGLWGQDYTVTLDRIKALGFNTVRLPFANETWQLNPKPSRNVIGACPTCQNKRARDILALIVNYAGSIGLHVVMDNHRSDGGNSAQANGLWYLISGKNKYTEQKWIADWVSVLRWSHGIPQTQGATDTVAVNYLASDGFPTIIGFDLRNEPHTVCQGGCDYAGGASWGTGDGINPAVNPNPNPFSPACVATGTCKDWRLAAQRAGDTILGEAAAQGWDFPLIVVEGVSQYPVAGGTHAAGPYDFYWWGGQLQGVNGNSSNAGAPIVLHAGGNASGLGAPVANQVVYSAHDYGPKLSAQPWFNASTCYASGCGSSSLADVWTDHWAFINIGEVNPVWPGQPSYPWANTGSAPYSVAPVWLGEFGTANATGDLYSTGAGSQGQWFTDLVSFVQSSYAVTPANDSGIPVQSLHWAYWALNGNDDYGILANDWSTLANPAKEYTFLCAIQSGPLAVPPGSGAGQCGSTGALPSPQ
jgi:endoglucanase